MLNLHFAASLDRLVPVFMDTLRRSWHDPFAAPAVIVPSPALGKWLKMRLAGGTPDAPGLSCVANLDMQTLERFLWQSLEPDDDMVMTRALHLQQVICALLELDLVDRPDFAPLRDYLVVTERDAAGAPVRRLDPLKRVQLSARIAHQFLEYEYNRPSVWDPATKRWRVIGIDQGWLADRPYPGAAGRHETWQRALYRAAMERLACAADRRYRSLPQRYRERRESAGPLFALPSANVVLFGVTKISHFHRNILVEMSQQEGVEMTVFLTNPCAEFWEDVRTDRRSMRRAWTSDTPRPQAGIAPRAHDDYQIEDLSRLAADHPLRLPRDHRLLELWGAAGKENIFLWCPEAHWNFEYHGADEAEEGAPATLLAALQQSLLTRRDELRAPAPGRRGDGSLAILAAPDRGREVEELRELILDLVHGGAVERLNEIAVYCPDPGAYAPVIRRVFGAYRPGDRRFIPFTLLGVPGGESVYARGVLLFLDLLERRFDRPRVFELLRNPVVQAGRGITAEQVSTWEIWAETLGIFRGYDSAHREAMGDRGSAVTDEHTFALGLRRLLVGNLAAGPLSLGQGDPLVPCRDYDTGDADLLEAFCAAVEDLYRDLADCAACLAAGPRAGLERLAAALARWFGEIPADAGLDASAEGRARREFLDALAALRIQSECAGRAAMDLDEFTALVRGCVPQELPSFAAAWVGGVTFAPLRPAMIVPHRVIVILGLDAAAFPGSNDAPAWNLLSNRRIVGDSDPVRDNRFTFLEALHAAGERLVLSYRARDMQKEEELQPSSVLLELESWLTDQGLCETVGGERRCAVRREIPWVLHESLLAGAPTERPHGTWDAEERTLLTVAQGGRLEHRHELARRHRRPAARRAAAGELRTSVAHLKKFFVNPLEYHLSKTLGLELDGEPGTLEATDEPLDSGALARSILQKKIWTAVLRRLFPAVAAAALPDEAALGDEAAAFAGRLYDEHAAEGRAPEGQLRALERQALVAWARDCAAVSQGLAESFGDHRLVEGADLGLGRPDVSGDLTLTLPGGAACTLVCRHALVLAPRSWETAGATLGIVDFKKAGAAAENHDLWLAGVVQWIAERRADRATRIRLVELNRDDDGRVTKSEAAMRREAEEDHDPAAWLGALLAEMLLERCSDHLPFVVIRSIAAKGWEGLTVDAVIEKMEADRPVYRSWLPVFDLADARLPAFADDEELRRVARRRYEPMIEGWFYEQ